MTYFVRDKAEISDTRRTGEGYVTARAKAVRVMRPDAEVFATDSAATFSHVPVTVGHPREMVDAAVWQDAGGNRYAVASAVVGSRFADDAAVPLAEPPWGADMAAAARAQALIQLGPPAAPDRLAAVVGDDAAAAVAVLGITRLAEE